MAICRRGDSFVFGTSPTRFRLIRGADGAIKGVEEASILGPPLSYLRTTRSQPSPTALAALAGEYRSSELDVTYTLSMIKDRLMLTSLGFPDPMPLIPAEKDHFDPPVGHVIFVRDGKGRATGFTLNAGRTRELEFIRRGAK